jgi:hypothetical protein
MTKRKCARKTQQEGVCGCPSFWRRLKPNSKPNIKDSFTPTTKPPPDIIVINSESEDECDLHLRKRQKREDSALPRAEGVDIPSAKSSTYTDSYFMVREHAAQVNKQAQESGGVKRKKAKAQTPVKILVDYDLPTGAERLDWDTDEVRRMVGEIG